MCTSPSRPSSILTKTPNSVAPVTMPSSTSPTLYFSTRVGGAGGAVPPSLADKFLFFRICGDDEHFQFCANHFLELNENLVLVSVRNARIVRRGELGGREESGDSVPVDDESALVGIGNGEFEYCFLLRSDFCFVPNKRLARLA